MRKPKDNYQNGVRCVESPSSTQYWGKAKALIAAGILSDHQVPGQPGMPTTSASFVDGQLVDRYARPQHDQRWMQVSLYGNGLRVIKGLRRVHQSFPLAERTYAISPPRPSIGAAAANIELTKDSALLRPGQRVRIGGQPAVVDGEFKLRRVLSETGEFVLGVERFDYLPGYTCRDGTGVPFFCLAHEITSVRGERTHLKLVRTRSASSTHSVRAEDPAKASTWPFPNAYGGLPASAP